MRSVAEDDLDLLVLLPRPPECCWDCRQTGIPTSLVYSAKDQTQNFQHARQALASLSSISSPTNIYEAIKIYHMLCPSLRD